MDEALKDAKYYEVEMEKRGRQLCGAKDALDSAYTFVLFLERDEQIKKSGFAESAIKQKDIIKQALSTLPECGHKNKLASICSHHLEILPDMGCWVCRAEGSEHERDGLRIQLGEVEKERDRLREFCSSLSKLEMDTAHDLCVSLGTHILQPGIDCFPDNFCLNCVKIRLAMKRSEDAFRRLQTMTNCACHEGENYVHGSVCQDCFGQVNEAVMQLQAALDEANGKVAEAEFYQNHGRVRGEMCFHCTQVVGIVHRGHSYTREQWIDEARKGSLNG